MSVYSDFNTYCIATFGALAEPLVQATFGTTPAYVVAGDWTYPSRNSASIAFETTLPCKGRVEWGTTTAYGNLTALPDRFYYNHLHYLTGLTPGVTYHYRLVAVDESGVTVTSADRTITTVAMASAIAIPGGAYATPYVCSVQGATYILTGNITAQRRGISVEAYDVTIDLNGYTISYDNGAPVNSGGISDAAQLSSAGINFFKWNADTQGLTRFLNGTITQGSQNSAGAIDGTGLNPIGIYYGKVEVAGITATYSGVDVSGIVSIWGPVNAHHNNLCDLGTGITNRSQGMKAIYAGSVGVGGIHHNLIRRTRHQGIMQKYASGNTNGIFSNEIYGDVYATNGYMIGAYPLVYSNKVFGTGYHCVGISHIVDQASADISMLAHHNFIHLHGGAPFNSSCPLDSDTNPDASVIGVRFTYYLGETRRYDGYIYEYNTIIVRGNSTKDVRGAQLATSQYHSGCHFRFNTVKYETTTSVVRGAAINLQGNTTPGAAANENPCYIENNTILTNDRFLRFGDKYSCGGHQQFRNNTFTKTGTSGTYEPMRFGEGNNAWDSYGNRLIDSVLGTGVSLSTPALDGTGGRRDYSIGHSLYIRALGNGDVPLANATVTVNDNTGLSLTVTTDASGIARVEIIEDFYEALDGAGAMTHTTRSGWNLQTAGYGTRTLTAPELAVSNNSASPLAIRFGTGAPPADTTAPGTVTTLATSAATHTGCTLTWTAPGDDGGVGTATSYEIRRALAPVTTGTWNAATVVSGAPTPTVAGTVQTLAVTGLFPGTVYYFAIRATDEAGNVGAVSNSPSVTTGSPSTDTTGPRQITDLAASNVTSSAMTMGWTAPGDDGGSGTVASYEMRYSTSPLMDASPVPIMANGSLYPTQTAQVTTNFYQDIGSNSPATAAALANGETLPILHFVPPCTPQYAAALSAICGGEYQWTPYGGNGNPWTWLAITPAVPAGAWGAPSASAVISGDLASREFVGATVYVNLSRTTAVACGPAPGGSLPALGVYIATTGSYPVTDASGTFPQQSGIFWGQTTANNLAGIATWKTWIGNNAQTEGPREGVNSATPVADWRAARAAAVTTHTAGRFLESHNGLGVFVDATGTPNQYWPVQQRIHAFCQLDPTARWIYEDGVPMTITGGVGGSSTVRLFDITDDRLQEFIANEVLTSVARCGADGAFGDEWHAIHPNRGSAHPNVPEDVDWVAGMIRLCESMNSAFTDGTATSTITPAVAGTAQTKTISGLDSGTTYYVAIRSTDDAGNVSLLSNVVTQTTAVVVDTTAPIDIADLAVTGHGQTTVSLEWSSPIEYNPNFPLGDHLSAASYDLRYSTANITSGNFASATAVSGVPTPNVLAEQLEGMTVSGLAPSTTYYFAIKSVDAAGNWSDISNVVDVRTDTDPTVDVTAPSAISTLVVPILLRTTTTLTLQWTAPGDDAGVGTAAAYDIRYSTANITSGNFDSATPVSGEPTPLAAGTAQSYTITGLTADTAYYVAMKSVDEAGNWSAISNVVARNTAALPADRVPPADTTDLAASDVGTNSVRLTWTAPGDDGASGVATLYDIRYDTDPITQFSFVNATQVSGEPVPGVYGAAQSVTVTGLDPDTYYYFALSTMDEAGNYSGLSNVVSAKTTSGGTISVEMDCPNTVTVVMEA